VSSRQLTDSWWYWLRIDHSLSVSRGFAWQYRESNFTIPGGNQEVIYVRTGSLPVVVWSHSLDTDQSRGAILSFWHGGDVTPGPELSRVPLNHYSTKPEPFVSFAAPSVIVTPGDELGTVLLGEGSNLVPFLSVLRPNEDYYLTIDNLSNQSALMNFSMSAGGIAYPLLGSGPAPVNVWPGNVQGNVGVTTDDDGFDVTFGSPNQAYLEWNGSNASGRSYSLEMSTTTVSGIGYIRGANGFARLTPDFELDGDTKTSFDIPANEIGWQLFVDGSLTTGRVDAELYQVPSR